MAAFGRDVTFWHRPADPVYAATLEEFLLAAEYITAAGGDNVVLCERGIRTFETSTRFTLDLSAVIVAKRLTDLPVIVDPSHAAGRRDLVVPLSKAAATQLKQDIAKALGEDQADLETLRTTASNFVSGAVVNGLSEGSQADGGQSHRDIVKTHVQKVQDDIQDNRK